jgi:hypothetical protein
MSIIVPYMNWATHMIGLMRGDNLKAHFSGGIYLTLSEIFRIGQRSELLLVLPLVMKLITYDENS